MYKRQPYRRRSYAYLSDTLYSPRAAELVRGVDLLYHEATFADPDKAMARKTGHSTAAQAAKAALKAGAGKLLIGHFSSRYPDVEVLVNEARNIFPATEAVVEGESYDIRPVMYGAQMCIRDKYTNLSGLSAVTVSTTSPSTFNW